MRKKRYNTRMNLQDWRQSRADKKIDCFRIWSWRKRSITRFLGSSIGWGVNLVGIKIHRLIFRMSMSLRWPDLQQKLMDTRRKLRIICNNWRDMRENWENIEKEKLISLKEYKNFRTILISSISIDSKSKNMIMNSKAPSNENNNSNSNKLISKLKYWT